jgi:hypothetical protein
MMNGINFPIDGPVMSGTWYNPYTKDSFTVRDTFFENNQLMVQTTDGRMMDYNIIQSYVQCDPKDIPSQETKQTTQTKYNEIPAEVADLLDTPTPQDATILDEDMALISETQIFNRPTRLQTTINPIATSTRNPVIEQGIGQTEDQRLIQRVLSRQQQPSISCNINWTKFPQKQMDVLMDMMGVDLDDVCDFYISKIDLNDIRESIKRDIKTYIESAMGYNGIDEQYVPVQIQEPITIIEHTSTESIDYEETSAESIDYERVVKPQKKTTKTTKPTTKKTTKKK